MFWTDKYVERILAHFETVIANGASLIVRDEKTASGRVHVGSMRGVAIHGVLAQVLEERGVPVRYLYEINDLDPMDAIPGYLDEATYRPYFMRPLKDIPSPGEGARNYAEYYAQEFEGVIRHTGFQPEFYRASDLYARGAMNHLIDRALERRELVREIYQRVSGSEKSADWYPVNVIAPVSKGIPSVVGYADGKVLWRVEETGEEGAIDPHDGTVKLAWKVDWAAKWSAVDVSIEGGGKDHSTRGGSRDVANHISKEVFDREPPFDVPYEFFLVGGKKMSSSKGQGSSAKEVSDLLPPHIFRLALIGKEPMRAIDFVPDGDTIPVLFDTYDRIAAKVWGGINDDDTRLFGALHPNKDNPLRAQRFLPRFSLVAFLVQMPHLDLHQEGARLKESELTAADEAELSLRAEYARRWLDSCAPEDYRYVLQRDAVPQECSDFTDVQKSALRSLIGLMEQQPILDGQGFHSLLHEVKASTGIEPKAFFGALYLAFLGRDSGPKAGWFLSTLDRSFVLDRLRAVSA